MTEVCFFSHKALYLLAFEPWLAPVMNEHVLYALATMMEEKQLRIYTDLAEPAHEHLENESEVSSAVTMELISSFVDGLASHPGV